MSWINALFLAIGALMGILWLFEPMQEGWSWLDNRFFPASLFFILGFLCAVLVHSWSR